MRVARIDVDHCYPSLPPSLPPFFRASSIRAFFLPWGVSSLSSWDGQGAAWAVRSLRLAVEEEGGERPGSAFTALLR